jgi:hypothetical protein
MEKDDDVVIFGKYENAVDASIVKGVLASNGVESMLLGDTGASVLSFYPLDMAMVRVVVLRKDLERANEIMAANPIEPMTDDADTEADDKEE